jgi:phosphatidylserine/phosphatidylglycerophosphate/cardiolipin synthase-like enzyme
MAQVFSKNQCTAALEDIIRNATSEVYLISYSFRTGKTFLRHIRTAVERGISVKIVFGKFAYNDLGKELNDIKGLEVYYCEDLHAKVYCNDSKCIVGSMNFYEKKDGESIELGVLLTKEEDKAAYYDALRECREIYNEAARQGKKLKPEKENFPNGFCIRTGQKIPLNHERPFCTSAFHDWNYYGRKDFPEKFCHFTGEPSLGQTSMQYPVLSKNWEKYVQAATKDLTT